MVLQVAVYNAEWFDDFFRTDNRIDDGWAFDCHIDHTIAAKLILAESDLP